MSKKPRHGADISNDISEGYPVTKAEALIAYQWMCKQHQKQVDRCNEFRFALLKALAKDTKAVNENVE